MNPTVVMTDMGKIGWSDPVKAKEMLDKIPLGRFSGNSANLVTSTRRRLCLYVCLSVSTLT